MHCQFLFILLAININREEWKAELIIDTAIPTNAELKVLCKTRVHSYLSEIAVHILNKDSDEWGERKHRFFNGSNNQQLTFSGSNFRKKFIFENL